MIGKMTRAKIGKSAARTAVVRTAAGVPVVDVKGVSAAAGIKDVNVEVKGASTYAGVKAVGATGVAIFTAVAAPIIAPAAIAYGIYRLVKNKNK